MNAKLFLNVIFKYIKVNSPWKSMIYYFSSFKNEKPIKLGWIPRRYRFLYSTQRYHCNMFPGYFEPNYVFSLITFMIWLSLGLSTGLLKTYNTSQDSLEICEPSWLKIYYAAILYAVFAILETIQSKIFSHY